MIDEILKEIEEEQIRALKLFKKKKLSTNEVDAILRSTTNLKIFVLKFKNKE